MDLNPFLFSLVFIFAVSVLVIFSWFHHSRNKKRTTVPEVAGARPVFGHLHLYDKANKTPTHVAFGAMADVYGPVFATKLGSQTVMIISSQEIAEECYNTVHDKLLDRPSITASKLLGYDDSFLTFSPYGPYWRQVRRMVTKELVSSRRVDMQKHYRAREADIFIRDLYRRWEREHLNGINGVVVDMKQGFHDLAVNMSMMVVVGKRYFGDSPNSDEEEAVKCRKLLHDYMGFFGEYLFSDAVPFLGWLDWGTKRAMKRTAEEIDKLLEGWVADHKEKKKRTEEEKDYLDLLIEIFESSKTAGLDAQKTTKALCLNMVLAGSVALIVVLVWALSLLVNNPQVLRKAQEEIDNCVGKNRAVDESDIKDLVYLQAIVKETFRLYPPVPLVAFRFVMEDFDIMNGKHHIPAGTKLLASAWKIQRDPSLWANPEGFEPERFLRTGVDKGVDMGRHGFKLFPFGLGRRSCPAIPLSLRMVHYLLARFVHSFDIASPLSEGVDMTESNGLVNLKATPLEVLITPRLDPKLYQVI